MNNVRVLLIEDDGHPPPYHHFNALQGQQFCFTREASLATGLVALREMCFDLVVLNLSLPDASAAESVRRTVEMASQVPVVALVSEADSTKTGDDLSLRMMTSVLKACGCDSPVRTLRYHRQRRQLISAEEETRHETARIEKELAARLSHELRNALACIQQFGNILADGLAGPLCDEQLEYLGIMLQNATRINTALDDLLAEDLDSTAKDANCNCLLTVGD